jgi:hypothetical protein
MLDGDASRPVWQGLEGILRQCVGFLRGSDAKPPLPSRSLPSPPHLSRPQHFFGDPHASVQ